MAATLRVTASYGGEITMDSAMKSAIQVRADFSWNVSLNSDSSDM